MNSTSEHSRTNILLLERLEAAYNALSSAIYDPVIIVNPKVAKGKILPVEGVLLDVSQVFFYAEDEAGNRVMENRIRKFPDDLRVSYLYHESMARKFREIEEVLTERDKMKVRIHVETLCTLMEMYHRVVIAHQQKAGEEGFLQFPNYLGGKVGFRRGGVILDVPSFNPNGSERGYNLEIGMLRETVDRFDLAGHLTLGGVHTGRIQTYYEALRTVRNLFQDHLGFEVETVTK